MPRRSLLDHIYNTNTSNHLTAVTATKLSSDGDINPSTAHSNGNGHGYGSGLNSPTPTSTSTSTSTFTSTPTTEAKAPRSSWAAIHSHLKTDISLEHADIPVIACCLVSGLCDSSAYNAWTCFVSMQTGNTIFLALGASGQPIDHPYGWLKSFISIMSFIAGCLFFASTRFFNPKARGTLAISFLLQSVCIIIAAALVQAHTVPEPQGLMLIETINFMELLPLSFLAFQSGGQIVTSRQLGFNEVPTTVLTSVYCDLASDPKLLKRDNVKRNRRAGAVVAILLGGIVGGWISRSQAGISAVFWIAAAIKMAISIGWSIWKPATPPLA